MSRQLVIVFRAIGMPLAFADDNALTLEMFLHQVTEAANSVSDNAMSPNILSGVYSTFTRADAAPYQILTTRGSESGEHYHE